MNEGVLFILYWKANDLCAYPFIELYQDGLIHFLAPLSKQKDFYVPETGDVEVSELSAGQLEEGDQEDPEQSGINDEDKEKAADHSGEDSTNSESSFEQLDPPEK